MLIILQVLYKGRLCSYLFISEVSSYLGMFYVIHSIHQVYKLKENNYNSSCHMVDHVWNLCRGTYQPFCRSLPEDPLLECFESTDDSSIRGLYFLLATNGIYKYE